jgi:hypothetical protein
MQRSGQADRAIRVGCANRRLVRRAQVVEVSVETAVGG